jgi:hypothetical protein
MKIATHLAALALASLTACGTSDEGTSSYSLTQEPGNCGAIETHVFGIQGVPGGRASVHIARPGKHAVVVSAYDATTWTITAGPGVELEAIYAVGYEKQTIVGPRGVPAVAESKVQGDPYQCGYGWPESGGPECNTEELINLVEKRVHAVTSYHGCASATSFTLGADMAVDAVGCDQQSYVQNCDGEDSCGGPVLL